MIADRSSPSTSSITSASPSDPVDLSDVRMIERGQGLRFAREAHQAVRVAGERHGQHFDGDRAIEFVSFAR